MPIVTDPQETRSLLDVLQRQRVAVPCFCTENAWTTEAVLAAALEVGRRLGIAQPPVALGFTAAYPDRSNLRNYWTCGDQRLGLRGLLGDLNALMSPGSPYASCRVLPQLDHGQPDEDGWIFQEHLDELAIVMFDGSALPLEDNVRLTADFVSRFSDRIVVEGAVDELKAAADPGESFPLTTPEQAQRFLEETGCDLIVPNVGTEHRAAQAGKAEYKRDRACEIAAAVGPKLVLHGTSCMGGADLSSLPHDGFVKVNVWTIVEKTGGQQIVEHALDNVGKMLERAEVEKLVADGTLGRDLISPDYVEARFGGSIGPHLDYFPLINLRRRWVREVAVVMEHYFDMFGYERLADSC